MRNWIALALLVFLPLRLAAGELSVAGLQAAAKYSAERRGSAFLVIQNGETVFEDYPGENSAGEKHKIYSGTKGFWILAALAAAEDGLLRLDEPVSATIGEWRVPGRDRITIRQLLNFTAGLHPMFGLHRDDIPDRNRLALDAPLVATAGARFIYGPAAMQVFGEVFRRKLAASGETPVRYLERRVLAPMGLGSQDYKKDRAGNPLLATGIRLTARQWAVMGRVVLAKGAPVVGSASFAECLRGTAANPAFGMGFWNNRKAGWRAREFDIEDMLDLDWQRQDWRDACICRDAPRDLVASIGSGYQRLFVIPSLRLIVVRQGENARFSDGDFLRLILGVTAGAQ